MKPKFRVCLAAMWTVLTVLSLRSCVLASSESLSEITPVADAAFTATRQINALALSPEGNLWAATAGGVLRRSPDGAWRKWTRYDGLPAHEARSIAIENNGDVRVQFPISVAQFRDGKWQIEAHQSTLIPLVTWNGATWTATLNGLKRAAVGEKARLIALPPSNGTHISAMLVRDKGIYCALFGDGLWQFDGTKWSRAPLEVPAAAREITALAGDDKALWLGTRRAGIWNFDGARWQQFQQADEPFDHNIQNMVAFGGALWLSTLEDGLVARTAGGWKHFDDTTLSSVAPRQLMVFGGALWVRHGGGQVDRFDGKQWTKNVFPTLPRGKVLAMCADATRLYLGQWGGWSEWDGAHFQHFLSWPMLQGVPPMTLHASKETLWFGTQSRGLIEAKRVAQAPPSAQPVSFSSKTPLPPSLPQSTYQLRVFDERQALPDDWITALAQTDKEVCAGTFVGGLSCFDGKKWRTVPELSGQNVTALQNDGDGLWVATRNGLWHRDATGKMIDISARLPQLDRELQALCIAPEGLWVGARTGIFFVSRATLDSTLSTKPSASISASS